MTQPLNDYNDEEQKNCEIWWNNQEILTTKKEKIWRNNQHVPYSFPYSLLSGE